MKMPVLPLFRYSSRSLLLAAVLTAAAFGGAGCSSSGASAVPSSSSPPASSAATPQPSPSPERSEAVTALKQAESAAKGLKNYDFKMDLTQHLTGESADSNSNVTVNSNGRVETSPLKLDQQVKSVIDEDTYDLRAILTPDAYYMYDKDLEGWSRTTKSDTAEMVKTLSDFQVDPDQALLDVQALGDGLRLEGDKITFEGNGAEAKAFLEKVLESTLGLSGLEQQVQDSIKLGSLKVEINLDPVKHWPTSYRIDSTMTIEYEAGKPSTLKQTLSGTYSKPNAAEPVVVPAEAKDAPEIDSDVSGDDSA